MKNINLVVNCEVKILEDWFLGQRDILQIELETAFFCLVRESPSSYPLVFASSLGGLGFSF